MSLRIPPLDANDADDPLRFPEAWPASALTLFGDVMFCEFDDNDQLVLSPETCSFIRNGRFCNSLRNHMKMLARQCHSVNQAMFALTMLVFTSALPENVPGKSSLDQTETRKGRTS